MGKATNVEYKCPDCGNLYSSGTVSHQHLDGEWIFTDDLRRYWQQRRWDYLEDIKKRFPNGVASVLPLQTLKP